MKKFIYISFATLFIMSFFVDAMPNTVLAFLPLIAAGAVSALGGITASLAGAADQQKANDALTEAYKQITAIGAPPDLAKQIIYDKFNQVGLYTPELQKAVEQHYSNLANVNPDATGRTAQVGALQKLNNLSNVGVTATERAALNKITSQASRDNASKQAAIVQNMQARGQAGSGAELAARLGATQSGTQLASQQADDLAAQANSRALDAIRGSASLGGTLRSQDTALATTKAQAADELNRFNVVQKQAVQNANVNAQNAAQKQNLAESQRLNDVNTQQTNQEKLRESQGAEQTWLDSLKLAQQKQSALQAKADIYNKSAQTTRNTIGGVGNALGDAIGSAAAYKAPAPKSADSLQTQQDSTYNTDDEEEKKNLGAYNPTGYAY